LAKLPVVVIATDASMLLFCGDSVYVFCCHHRLLVCSWT